MQRSYSAPVRVCVKSIVSVVVAERDTTRGAVCVLRAFDVRGEGVAVRVATAERDTVDFWVFAVARGAITDVRTDALDAFVVLVNRC